MAGVLVIRRAILRLLGAPSLPAALARIEQITARVDELTINVAALTLQADSEEHRADEAERLLDREQMINKRLGEELARARSTAGASWLVPRSGDEDAAPRSIRTGREAVLSAEVASLRRELAEARRGPCTCSADARRSSDADEVLRP